MYNIIGFNAFLDEFIAFSVFATFLLHIPPNEIIFLPSRGVNYDIQDRIYISNLIKLKICRLKICLFFKHKCRNWQFTIFQFIIITLGLITRSSNFENVKRYDKGSLKYRLFSKKYFLNDKSNIVTFRVYLWFFSISYFLMQ